MQAGVSGVYEGGCPFNNFDADTLRNLLQTSLTEDQTRTFLNNDSIKRPEVLCTAFQRFTVKNNIDDSIIINPVQYYKKLTN